MSAKCCSGPFQHGRALKALPQKAEQLTLTRLVFSMSKATPRFPPFFFAALQAKSVLVYSGSRAWCHASGMGQWQRSKRRGSFFFLPSPFTSAGGTSHARNQFSALWLWNSKRAWRQRVGLLWVSLRHSAGWHCEGLLARWQRAPHHYGLGNNRLCYCSDIQQIR